MPVKKRSAEDRAKDLRPNRRALGRNRRSDEFEIEY